MKPIIDNPKFREAYEQLRQVSLNPERHSAPNAHAHCELVVERTRQLAQLNHLDDEETQMLVNLAWVHDIGKVSGNARPAESVDMLPEFELDDDTFRDYVKYHDINLPWYISHCKGQTPGDKSWRKLAGKVDLRLLCMFMIADRVDCPGGWQANDALVWFLDEAARRGLLPQPVRCD